MAARVPRHLVGHRRREQQGLLLLRQVADDALDVLEEAHRQHLVALVEDEGRDGAGIEGAAADVIEDAAGGADDDVDALLERGDLLADRRAAVERLDDEAAVLADRLQLARDLQRQLAGGGEDQRLRGGLGGHQAVEQRQPEGGRLAGAGARLHQQVLAFGDRLEHGGLHGGGPQIAHVVEGGADVGVKPQLLERRLLRLGGLGGSGGDSVSALGSRGGHLGLRQASGAGLGGDLFGRESGGRVDGRRYIFSSVVGLPIGGHGIVGHV